jgi:hypothetical protein
MASSSSPFSRNPLELESDGELDVSGEVEKTESDRDLFMRGELERDEFISREVERALAHLAGELSSERLEMMRVLLSEEMRESPVFSDLLSQLERRAS